MQPTVDEAFARAVAELLPAHLPAGLALELGAFCALLRAANDSVNLTAITDARGMATLHVQDALLALDVLDGEGTLVDLGSGGGLPGVPLALALPEREMVLIESRRKRAEALAGIVEALGLSGRVRVERVRGEEWLAAHPVDTVVTRALGPVARQLELLAPLRGSFRRLVLLKGPAADEELAAARPRLLRWGFAEPEIRRGELPGGAGRRVLLVFRGAREVHAGPP